MSSENKILYEERLKRVNDAVNLKEPDRVPLAPMYEAFPFLYAGYTMAEANYDISKARDALKKYLNHFQPDMAISYHNFFCGQMSMLDMVGIKWLQWAGQKGSMVPDCSIFQYVEKEYLEADEYPEFLSDMSGWILRKYLPRSFKIFECFEKVDFRSLTGYGYILDLGDTMEDCKPELVEVMFETVKTYGVYK
jgi:hypothetical protein